MYTCTREWYTFFLILHIYMHDYKIRIHIYIIFNGVHTSFTYIRIMYSRVHGWLSSIKRKRTDRARLAGGAPSNHSELRRGRSLTDNE